MDKKSHLQLFLFIFFNGVFSYILYITFLLYLSRLAMFPNTYEPDPIGFLFFIPAIFILCVVSIIIQSTNRYFESSKIATLICIVIPTLFFPPFLIELLESLKWNATSYFLGWYGVIVVLGISIYYFYLILNAFLNYFKY